MNVKVESFLENTGVMSLPTDVAFLVEDLGDEGEQAVQGYIV